MSKKENIIFISSLFFIILLLVSFQFYLYTKGFFSISADEAGRTLEAYDWYRGETGLFSIWLPFQKVLTGLSLHIYYDLFLVPRILSSLFGILALISLVFLTYEIFQDRIVSLITGFLGSLFFGIVIFSVLPLAEIYFFFFVIISIAFFLKWKRSDNNIYFWLFVFSASLGTTTRYEAWLFTFVLYIAAFIHIHKGAEAKRKKLFKVLGSALILLVFPSVWIYLSYISTGETTSFISSVSERYNTGKNLMELKNNVLYKFLAINFTSLNILGIIALIYNYNKNESVSFSAIIIISTLLIMSVTTFLGETMPTHNSWRLAAVWSVLLLPFTAQWLYHFFTDKSNFSKLNFVFFILILIYLFNSQTMNYANESYTTREDLVIGDFIRSKKDSGSKILIEENNWEYTNILVTSQHPEIFITWKDFFKYYNSESGLHGESIEEILLRKNINYLVLRPESGIRDNINNLHQVKKFSSWIIYKLN